MIKLYFEGGLGNQMFQYAFGRYAQEYFKEQVEYDISKYVFNAGEIREFELHSFNIAIGWKQCLIKEKTFLKYDIAFIGYRLVSIPYLLLNRYLVKNGKKTQGNRLFQRTINFFGYYRYYYGELYDFFPSINKNKHFLGHWFRKDIVEKMDNTIRNELRVVESVPPNIEKYLALIEEKNSVGVHIRRGDYVELGMIVCDINYYQNSMKMMNELVKNPTFFVFSDDINWVKNNLHTELDVIFVEGNHTAVLDMKLLYSCNHFILSNSTFSWWGAYLGDNKNKQVIAPRYWSNKRTKCELLLDTWIDVENF